MQTCKTITSAVAGLWLLAASSAVTADVGTAITYQGELIEAGVPIEGDCDFQFSLWNDSETGSQVGPLLAETVALARGPRP